MDIYKKQMAPGELLYSFHSFIFPFEWRTPEGVRKKKSKAQTDLEQVEVIMGKEDVEWERRISWGKPHSLVQFNELVYFYDFVRPVLYDTGQKDSLQRHYYDKEVSSGGWEYVISLSDGTIYRLEIDDIVVSFYDMGVGFLSFHLVNKKAEQSSPEDILRINALGRRLYPPFFATQTSAVGQQDFFDDADWENGLQGVKEMKELADEIRIEKNGKIRVKDDFAEWCCEPDLEKAPKLIRSLIPASVWKHFVLKPVLDDRMFTLCWYGNGELVKEVKGSQPDEDYLKNDWWYAYVFVDGYGKTCQNDRMSRDLLRNATNDRWAKYGTYYGLSRYSLVALTEHISANGFAAVICSHLQTIYYKIALLCLMQRAGMLRFSEDATAIGKLKSERKGIFGRVEDLYNRYVHFVHRVYFREVTAQEQGIELYDTLQQQMRLPEQVKELEKEIRELHNYGQLLEEGLRNEKLDILTYIAALFVVPSFIGTYFSISNFDMKAHWVEVSLMVVFSAFFALAFLLSKKSFCRKFWLTALAILILFSLFCYPRMVF